MLWVREVLQGCHAAHSVCICNMHITACACSWCLAFATLDSRLPAWQPYKQVAMSPIQCNGAAVTQWRRYHRFIAIGILHLLCCCALLQIQLKKFLATNLTPADLPDMLVLAVDLLSSAAAETMLSYILIDQQQHLTAMHQQLSAIQHQQQRRETRRSVQKQLKQQDLAAEATQLQAQIVLTQQQLQSVQLVEQLLTLAVARRHHLVVQQLCQLDAAKDVPVADLLHRAIGHKGAQEEVLDNLMHLLAKANVPLPSDKLVAILRVSRCRAPVLCVQ